MLRLKNKRITYGPQSWTVDATIARGEVRLTEIHGDVTNVSNIKEAVRKLLLSKPRYQRSLESG